jgi:acetyl-CoA carboxylase/biotin carboxylase 1
MMEMYADEEARAGVLEPEGIVNIKYRRDKQLETMARLDTIYSDLRRKLNSGGLSKEEASAIKLKMSERENLLLPVYTQISLQFADLHDRAGRMMAKGTIRQPLQWQHARRFFYWRIRRRLNEELFLRKMSLADRGSTRAENLERLKSLIISEDNGESTVFAENDRLVATWYEDNQKEVLAKIEGLRQDGIASEVESLLQKNGKSALRGVAAALGKLSVADREEVFKMLSAGRQN